MNKKKRVGYLYGRPVVEGDENEINAHEILAKKEDGYITLAANNNGLKSISHISSAGDKFGEIYVMSCSTSANDPFFERSNKPYFNKRNIFPNTSRIPCNKKW